ncbi:MAG: hypothetical protein ABH821_04800 [archaeon]
MPSLENHLQSSLKRTGESYSLMHEWLDGKNLSFLEKISRHNVFNVKKNVLFIEKRFGKPAVKEFLNHLIEDYNQNFLLELMQKIVFKLNGLKL